MMFVPDDRRRSRSRSRRSRDRHSSKSKESSRDTQHRDDESTDGRHHRSSSRKTKRSRSRCRKIVQNGKTETLKWTIVSLRRFCCHFCTIFHFRTFVFYNILWQLIVWWKFLHNFIGNFIFFSSAVKEFWNRLRFGEVIAKFDTTLFLRHCNCFVILSLYFCIINVRICV